MKNLVEKHPSAWLRLAGIEAPDVETLSDEYFSTLNSDLSTVTTACDKVFRINGAKPSLFHIEFESEGANLPVRVLRYAVILVNKYVLPVDSAAVLLRKTANKSEITGVVELFGADGERNLHFKYRVIKIWEIPVENILNGEIGILPLAPISRRSQMNLPMF